MVAEHSRLVEQFFRDLENPALYERVDGVPIFGPHVRRKKAPNGKWQEVRVDDKDLKKIAEAMETMERDKGTLPVITPGHRKLDASVSEEDQPPTWGYARWAKPGFYSLPNGDKVKTLLATVYFDKRQKAKDGRPVSVAARSFPHRSVDYYADTHEISGIAMLRRDPELELGLISYGGTRPLFQYSTENVIMDPTAAPDANAPADSGAGEELSPDDAGKAMSYAKHYEKHHPAFKYMCDSHAEQMAASASPTNTAVPAPTDGKTPPPDQMQRSGMPAQFARDFEDMKVRLAAAEKRERLTQYSAELLRARDVERYELDPAEEVTATEHLTPAQFTAYMARLRKNYRRDPSSPLPGIQYARDGFNGQPADSTDGRLPAAQEAQVFQYLREHPESDWDRAVAAVVKR